MTNFLIGNIKGQKGDKPAHQWVGTSLQFENPDGTQGASVNLKGNTGPANTLTIGTVSSGASAAANITGVAPNQILNLTLPKGDKGDMGLQGPTGAPAANLDFIYTCNGVNDNEILTQIFKDFYTNGDQNDNASMKIIVNGVVGITAEPLSSHPFANATSEADMSRFFDFSVNDYEGTRKFIIDFSNATVPQKTYTGNFAESRYCTLFFSNALITIENASIDFELKNTGSNYGTAYGFYGGDTYINCTGNGIGTGTGRGHAYGFFGGDTYINCIGNGIGAGTGYFSGYAYGFFGGSTFINCTGEGTGGNISYSDAYGFYSSYLGTYINCNGYASNAAYAYGFCCYGSGMHINCKGSGTGKITAYGFYFSGNSGDYSQYIFCTAMAHVLDTSSVNTSNCVPIYNDSTSANLHTTVINCRFPSLTWGGHKQGVVWYSSNIANTTIAGALRDNVYNGTQFTGGTNGVSKGSANLITDNNANVTITNF